MWKILWHFIWHIFSHSIWHSIWHIFLHSIWLLRSSGAHWTRKAPGWGPAVRTELGRSQVEVQRCALSWEGPRLRSSSAHWARKLAKSLAKSWQGNSGRGSGGRGGRRGEGGEGGGRRRRKRRRTTLITSNNPHLAGGEKRIRFHEGFHSRLDCRRVETWSSNRWSLGELSLSRDK